MQIEEVIAIAKTLRPDHPLLELKLVFAFDDHTHEISYSRNGYFDFSGKETFWGNSWEEALHYAGWKAKLPEDKCGGDGTYPTVT